LWFAWNGASLWLASVVRSQRWTDLQRENGVSVVVDAGHEFTDLRGVEVRGGRRTGGRGAEDRKGPAGARDPGTLYADKYRSGRIYHDGRHAWLRITPEKVVSWDFCKMAV
jgi:hypothetical protein